MRPSKNRSLLYLAFACCAALVSPRLSAQEVIMRNDMWDFDQCRTGLIDNGIYYCVPTSYVDMFEYMANHGMPGMDGSYTNSYSDITNWIFFMGFMMGTNSADKGTSGNNAWNIGNWWISSNNTTNEYIVMYKYGGGHDWSWRTIRNLMRTGALCRIARGKYQHNPTLGFWARIGGHAVMVAGFLDDGNGNRQIVVADPNNDTDLGTQAPFALVGKATSDITFTTQNHGSVKHARYTFNTGANGDIRYVIDGMHAVLPFMVGWTTASNDSNTFSLRVPFQMNEATNQWPTSFSFSTTDNVIDWCFDVQSGGVVYLTDDGKVFERDPFDGTKVQLADIPNAKKVAVGGMKQDIYVLKQGAIFDDLHYVPRKGGFGVIKSLSGRFDALDFDPVRGGPVVTRYGLGKFMTFSRTLGTRIDEPVAQLSMIPPALGAGETLFKVDGETGDYLLSSDGNDTVYRYRRHGAKRYETKFKIQSTAGIRALSPAPRGDTLVQVGSRLASYNRFGQSITTRFTGMTVPSTFKAVRSEFAADPAEYSMPGMYDQRPGPNEP